MIEIFLSGKNAKGRMTHRPRHQLPSRRKVSFALLCVLFAVLWLAGGGSRADIMGQVISRAAAWVLLIAGLLFGAQPVPGTARPVWIVLLAIIALALLQLIPLPPGLWQMLPGRAMLTEAAAISGQVQPWRPLAIVPDAAANAVSSLIVPLTALFLLSGLDENDRAKLPGIFVLLIAGSALVAVVQLSGADRPHPFLNGIPGQISGIFANRNHFALFLALGCVVTPYWAFQTAGDVPTRGYSRRDGLGLWRAPTAVVILLLLLLLILATGSRAGMLVGGLGLAAGTAVAWRGIKQRMRHYSRRVLIFLGAGIALLAIVLLLFSVMGDRAASISRVITLDAAQDLRSRSLPTVLEMVREYFPAGAGFGSFDPLFRMHEPTELLMLTYFNHAHSDFIEVILDTGLPGLGILLGAIGWWLVATVKAIRVARETHDTLPAVGAALLLLIAIASAFDYPVRTPLIMATMILAAYWLSLAKAGRQSALPLETSHL
jgi:O-antigen ligase